MQNVIEYLLSGYSFMLYKYEKVCCYRKIFFKNTSHTSKDFGKFFEKSSNDI